MCSNFSELVGKNVEPIKTIRDSPQLCGEYINTTLVRKLGHSLISQKYFEIEVERERGEREREVIEAKLKLGFGFLKN